MIRAEVEVVRPEARKLPAPKAGPERDAIQRFSISAADAPPGSPVGRCVQEPAHLRPGECATLTRLLRDTEAPERGERVRLNAANLREPPAEGLGRPERLLPRSHGSALAFKLGDRSANAVHRDIGQARNAPAIERACYEVVHLACMLDSAAPGEQVVAIVLEVLGNAATIGLGESVRAGVDHTIPP